MREVKARATLLGHSILPLQEKEEKNKEKLEKIEENIKIILKDKTKYEKQINEIEDNYLASYKNIKVEDELNQIIYDNKEKIVELENKKIDHNNNLEKIKQYNEYLINKEKYDSWKKKITDLEQKEKEGVAVMVVGVVVGAGRRRRWRQRR